MKKILLHILCIASTSINICSHNTPEDTNRGVWQTRPNEKISAPEKRRLLLYLGPAIIINKPSNHPNEALIEDFMLRVRQLTEMKYFCITPYQIRRQKTINSIHNAAQHFKNCMHTPLLCSRKQVREDLETMCNGYRTLENSKPVMFGSDTTEPSLLRRTKEVFDQICNCVKK